MSKLTAVQNKAIKEAVGNHFNKGLSLDDTALLLTQNGIGFSEIQNTIHSVGVKNDWVLTPEKIKAKVLQAIEGKTITHFLDVLNLAKSIDLAQLSIEEKQNAIIDFSGISKSVVAESAKFKQLHNSGIHGKIADWCKLNPNFTAQQLHDSGAIPSSTPKQKLYYDEFLAYREFFA